MQSPPANIPETTPGWTADVRRRIPFYVVTAVLIAGIAGVLTYNYLLQIRATSVPSKKVLVARVDVYPGELILSDMVEIQSVPEGILASGHLTQPAEAVGRIAVLPILAKEVVLSTRLSDGAKLSLSAQLPDGTWAMVLPGTWLASPLPEIALGDRLDLLAYQSGQPVESAGLIATAVQILSNSGESPMMDHLILAVSYDQARLILFSRANGFSILPLLRPKDR